MKLHVPWTREPSPHRAEAARRNADWLAAHGMVRDPRAAALYDRWDIPGLAALSFPDLDATQLALATDLFAFYFLFDDQFDGELGLRPEEVARVTDELTGVAYGVLPAGTLSPVVSAFADLWRRLSLGMSERWRARAAYNWEWYFSTHPSEALGRSSAVVPSRDAYLMLRRGADGTETVLDAVEHFHGEVPPVAFHNPELRLLRQYAADAPAFSNDIWSYPKEAPRGDVYNLVVIEQHRRGCSLEQAMAAISGEAQAMIDAFAALAQDVPRILDRLGVRGEEAAAVLRYRDTLAAWLHGYLVWESSTLRYRAEGALPVEGPNYVEELLVG